MMMMSRFTTPQSGDVGLSAIGARTVDAVAVLMIDPRHDEVGMQRVPSGDFIGMSNRALGNPLTDDL